MDGGINMKKTKVIHLGGSKFIATIRENIIVVFFALIFITGFLLACLVYRTGNLKEFSKTLYDVFVSVKLNGSFLKVFSISFLTSFVFLFLVELFGTSLTGCAFIPLLILVRGLIYGFVLCDLYSLGKLNALIINIIIILPSAIICVLTLFCASAKSINLSYFLGKLSLGDGQALTRVDIKNYLLSFVIYVFITVLSSLLEAFLSTSFIDFF